MNPVARVASQEVVAVFTTVADFKAALMALDGTGFSHAAVSVLGPHAALIEHFDEAIPPVEILADLPGTPREELDVERTARTAIHAVAEGLAIVGMAAAAAVSYAVGGPVGIAGDAGTRVGLSLDAILTRQINSRYASQYAENLRDGGIVCWVSVHGSKQESQARKALQQAGGRHVHRVHIPAVGAKVRPI